MEVLGGRHPDRAWKMRTPTPALHLAAPALTPNQEERGSVPFCELFQPANLGQGLGAPRSEPICQKCR